MLVLLASSNRGKLAEFKHMLPESVQVKSADEFGVELPEETGTTFFENAVLKARAVANATAQISVADDSGLEVDALDGAPGVWSARFAGQPSDDQKNNALLLQKLSDVEPIHRTARFRSVVAVVAPNGEMFAATGAIEGRILETPRGSGGFGYDPLFQPNGFTQTMAELSLEEKNRISHRGIAFRGIVENLLTLLETYES